MFSFEHFFLGDVELALIWFNLINIPTVRMANFKEKKNLSFFIFLAEMGIWAQLGRASSEKVW